MDYDVIVVGGGPVGMMLASELALAEVKVCILERLKDTTPYSRALTLHPRTLEIMDMRGLKQKLLSKGKPLPTGHFAALDCRLNFSELDSSSNYTLVIPQYDTEKVLEEWAKNLGVELRREEEVISVRQDEKEVEIVAVGPKGESRLTAEYVVGAEGARSTVRKQAGIPFTGTNETFTAMLGDVVLSNPTESNVVSHFSEQGLVMIVPFTSQMHRIIMIDRERMAVPKEEPVTIEELRSGLIRILGSDLGISESYWLSRFGNATRQAESYREGRIFLAGDAAHIHLPAGGQGLNVGLQEAMNIGWKLAAKLKGRAPDWLLDSYHQERFPINTALLRNTEIQALLMTEFSPRVLALRSMMSELLQIPKANHLISAQISALDVRYTPDAYSPQHVLNGSRLTDLKLSLENHTTKNAYELLHSGSFLLLHLASDERLLNASIEWSQYPHLQFVCASLTGEASEWDDVHTALIRPDGYIAWAVSQLATEHLEVIKQGIRRWCGGDDFS
ncbi:monooxygenase [Paenibacillus apiarius]|uniref:monooxygenase n=1 Tax=Paenibacillus apiarius TaxID=46240 RepID=UPI003B3B5569